MRFALIVGLDGYATFWKRHTTFCDEEDPFWFLVRHVVALGDDHDRELSDILPMGPLGQYRYGLFYSKDLLERSLNPKLQAFRNHLQKLEQVYCR